MGLKRTRKGEGEKSMRNQKQSDAAAGAALLSVLAVFAAVMALLLGLDAALAGPERTPNTGRRQEKKIVAGTLKEAWDKNTLSVWERTTILMMAQLKYNKTNDVDKILADLGPLWEAEKKKEKAKATGVAVNP